MRANSTFELAVLDWPPSAEERALVAELAELDRSFDRECDALWGPGDELEPLDGEGPGAGTEIDDVEVIASVLEHGVEPWSLALLASIDPQTLLDPLDRVRHLQAFDQVAAYVAAGQQRALVAVAGLRPSGDLRVERHVEHEVAIARRMSRGRAGRDIELARTLRAEFRGTSGALERGEITLEHAAALVVGTRHVSSARARAEIEARVLPDATRCSPAAFRRRVDAAVCAVDAEDEARRHARARGDRQVWVRRVENGLGELVVIDEWSVVSAMYERITGDALDLQRERRAGSVRGCEDPLGADGGGEGRGGEDRGGEGRPDGGGVGEEWAGRTLDNCRADALSDLVLRDDDPERDRPPRRRPPRPRRPERGRAPRVEGRLVIDLATLRGEADNPCLLDGSPVPASIGRRLARDVAHWRRMVTDPVDGHLLDYGRRTYLPDRLRAFVGERDRTCRNPWCDQSARRGQMDHADPFPHGPSSAANTGALCVDCHRIKTDRGAHLEGSASDGSGTWRTAWGQRVPIPATRYLDDGGRSHRETAATVDAPATGPAAALPGAVAGVLDRFADAPPPRVFAPPEDVGDLPPF